MTSTSSPSAIVTLAGTTATGSAPWSSVSTMSQTAPIGSGLGIQNPANLKIIIELCDVPVIVDAGVGTASDVAVAFELGAAGVLLNTGVAGAADPVAMATAVKHAGVSCNDVTDEQYLDQLSGNAAVNGVPVSVQRL